MKLGFFYFGLLTLATATNSSTRLRSTIVADKEFLHKQKAVIRLLWGVTQPVTCPKIIEIANNFRIEENSQKFINPEVVKRIVALQKYGTLSKEEIFSVFNQKHLEEAIALFDVFYHAKDFDTFYKAACWSRVNFNPGLFAYAFTLAVVHHKSFLGIVLPPPYEIFPQLFVDSELIEKAYQIKLVKESKKAEGPVEPVVITVNGSGFYPYYHYDFGRHSDHQGSNSDVYEYRVHPEKRVSYFTEDVALNSYNYYRHIYNPFFLNETHDYNTEGRGELFLYHHQQIIARYFLERLSNNLFSIKPITFTHPIRYGYNSNLRYPNGKPFPIRPDTMRVNEDTNFEFQLIDDFYRRLFDAVDLGFIITAAGEKLSLRESTGVDYLGHLIEATASSVNPKFYGKIFNLAMKAFGHVVDFNYNNDVAPGVLENYETALRDPLYYRLVASLINLYNRHKSHLESYNHEDLSFPGVKINGVEVDELVTFFENFDFDITSAVPTKSMFDDVVIKVRQYRLNHKPFTYKINITSDNNTGAMVRVFIGSKYDVEGRLFNINEKRKYMVEIDRFPIEVSAGESVIRRNSENIFASVHDQVSTSKLYNSVKEALEGKSEFLYEKIDRHCGFPSRFVLPKGKIEGLPLVFFVAVTPVTADKFSDLYFDTRDHSALGCGKGLGLFPQDGHAMGFPFDRRIKKTHFYVPNFYEKEVVVFHKRTNEALNASI